MLSRRARGIVVLILSTLLATAGCAHVGPRVSGQEIRSVQQELAAKAFLKTAEQQARIWTVGYRLLAHLPEDASQHPAADLGLAVAKIGTTARRAFGYDATQRGVCVLAVREGGAAQTAGVKAGDVLVAIDGRRVPSLRRFSQLVKRLDPGESATLTLARAGERLDVPLATGICPWRIQFAVSHDQSVNAWAKGDTIALSSGLLRFIESDDELAVVLGHELAHITERHRGKSIATGALAAAFGAGLGVATELVMPGAGPTGAHATSGVTQALTRAAFSRNFEREADYKGLFHTFRAGYDVRAGLKVWERFATEIPESLSGDLRSTHPASPERMIRIRKIADSLAEVGLEGTIARYDGHGAVGQRPPPSAPR